ncbi:glycerophosphodiester phosphodiesterase GDPDL3-like [Silene latifolia]|uniref:glycerophosphodiester phosphodiesterase GDPDL3-like n=1 Tax=Silene latifolia TaxID=37657 RepID=UPI003D780B73
MGGYNVVALGFVLLQLSTFILAQNSTAKSPKWPTLDGSSPLVIARGGFSGLFPDSGADAYSMAVMTSAPDLVLWCDVQLTRDGAGICFPNIMLNNASTVEAVYPNQANSYVVDGVKTDGYFPIDFTLEELRLVSLTQGIYSRPPTFDGIGVILTVEDVFTQTQPAGFWLNIQHDAFYSQNNLSMSSYLISAAENVIISHISSPEIAFLQELATTFATTETKLIFRFLDQDAIEVSTNQTYGSLLKNLTFIQTFASGILVPKSYILPVDETSYLLPHTSLVADAHKSGLAVFASDFANDNFIPYNYSFNPVAEYLSFIDNKDFSVDGVLTDFPMTLSEARDCFAHVDSNASVKAAPLVISHFGASGDYPGCTDISYTTAISDGADVIDCPVQMSKDGIPFCLSSANLINSTAVTQTEFRNLLTTASEIQPNQGIFSFSLSWTDIQSLKPVISSPYAGSLLFRNPKFRNAGKLISLADFLDLAKNASSLSGVLIKIENAKYLATEQSMSVTDAVLSALEKTGYNDPTAKNVMIQSTSSAVLKAMKGKKYELVYEVDETIRGAPNATIADIKKFADSVVVNKKSVFPTFLGYTAGMTDVVPHIQSFKLPVYVQILRNEFSEIPYDFFSDPINEMNNYIMGAGVDGVITEFPKSAAEYKKNRCLTMDPAPIYMSPVRPGELIGLIDPAVLPPAQAPSPLLNEADISESPLPAVVKDDSSSPTATPEAPKSSPSGQHQITASTLLSFLSIFIAVCLML